MSSEQACFRNEKKLKGRREENKKKKKAGGGSAASSLESCNSCRDGLLLNDVE